MKQIITDVDGYSNFIINLEDLDIDIKIEYILYSVIDALINEINDDIIQKYFNKTKQYITLEELAECYLLKGWNKNDGLSGVFFERFVYNMLVIKNEPLSTFVLECLNKLDPFFKGDDFDVILWGTEKGNWLYDFSLNLSLNVIHEVDCIRINNQTFNFKEVLKKLYHSNKKCNTLEKADLFVKLKNSNRWFGVDVKLKVEKFKSANKNALPIRIALKTDRISKLKKGIFGEIEPFTFIFPKENDYGELSIEYYRFMCLILDQLAKGNINNIIKELYEFKSELILFFIENRRESLFKILDWFAKDLENKGVDLPERIVIPNTSYTLLINGIAYNKLNQTDFNYKVSIG
ncbi:hypothetical protein [Fusobacterium hwasookii]|uniref:hypothetical protein n=1 Tax=Fusobacterium hwasookii TaxID=1583098 RepID=UPI00049518AF|nr:hypothetical protein [Fusobacterium hwasookii]ALQ37992.1 hypothetical protein RN97_07140 [Fusobacterium hwasookii ChDC F300]